MSSVHADELALFHHVGDGGKFVDVSDLLDGGNSLIIKVEIGGSGLFPFADHLLELVSSNSLLEEFLGLPHFLHLVEFLNSAQELKFGLSLVRAEASISGNVASNVAHVEDLCVAGHGHGGGHGAGWAKVDDVAGLLEVGSLSSAMATRA